jgi:holliday junction DNA helicase RuvA
MIASLRGPIILMEGQSVVVEVGGVGLQVSVPASFRDRLHIGENTHLYTNLVVRQDALTLYGFESQEQKEFFSLLLQVNGVGPRMALGILSVLNPDAIRRAVFHEQAEIFNRVPGVGKKTAQKILLSLQDRITQVDGFEAVSALSDVDGEVLAALTGLGYSIVEAQSAIQSIPREASKEVEERLRLALQYLGGP